MLQGRPRIQESSCLSIPLSPRSQDTGVLLHAWFSFPSEMVEGLGSDCCVAQQCEHSEASDTVGLNCVGLWRSAVAFGNLFKNTDDPYN